MNNCFIFFILFFITTYCTPKKEPSTSQSSPRQTLKAIAQNQHTLNDRQLAQAICGTCHIFPEPGLLDKKTWINGVLPKMAQRLGFLSLKDHPYALLSSDELQAVINGNIFPGEPLIDSTTWQRIVNYYGKEAPEKPLEQDNKLPVMNGLTGFKPLPVHVPVAKPPLVTLISFDSIHNLLYLGDRRNNLYQLNNDLQLVDSLQLNSPPSGIVAGRAGELYIAEMGEMDPNDKATGKLIYYNSSQSQDTKQASTVLENLTRPVHVSLADLNADGLEDITVCAFGNYTGKLAWYEKLQNGQYQEHILKPVAGARKTVVTDINADGLPDIIALMTQGDEGIFAFLNLGKSKFQEVTYLRFPPVYGSSDFELIDFNRDGFLDILYTNGDNADFSYSLKKYHGVRLFLNKGANQFEQAWFYPLHGATKALARDFDQDGDLDIAAIAFFPDYEYAPDEGFVFFENTGMLTFQPQTFPNAVKGRWLTMDAADIDQDNDVDILLGSFVLSSIPVPGLYRQHWLKDGPDFILLENQLNIFKALNK